MPIETGKDPRARVGSSDSNRAMVGLLTCIFLTSTTELKYLLPSYKCNEAKGSLCELLYRFLPRRKGRMTDQNLLTTPKDDE